MRTRHAPLLDFDRGHLRQARPGRTRMHTMYGGLVPADNLATITAGIVSAVKQVHG